MHFHCGNLNLHFPLSQFPLLLKKEDIRKETVLFLEGIISSLILKEWILKKKKVLELIISFPAPCVESLEIRKFLITFFKRKKSAELVAKCKNITYS